MSKYTEYLPELRTSTLFQHMTDEQIVSLLDAMQPEIVMRKAGDPMPPLENGMYFMALRSTPAKPLVPRQFPFDMPRFGECGMLMGEIPTMSRMYEGLTDKTRHQHPGLKRSLDFDLEMLKFTEDMVTKPYGDAVAEAQGIMLRNYLGILAQKVCDIRHELFLIKDGRDMFQRKHETLQVFTAGVTMGVAKKAVQRWNLDHPERMAELVPGHSVDLLRRIIAGERCDVLISADDAIIGSMLMPQYAKGYRVFAGNRMVVAGEGINSENWIEKLTDPAATFIHNNPYGDPGGYRAVMAILLADKVQPGLTAKLMDHPGHKGMDPRDEGRPGERPAADYTFTYGSGAASRGMDYAVLPAVMDLSDDALAADYAKATFAVDEQNTVCGTPIAHALTIPTGALYPEEAKAFCKLFLKTDFAEAHFLPKDGVVGEDPLA